MSRPRHIVVVGASQAGTAVVDALRGSGFDGAITMIGDEPHAPYTRPPLSKSILTGVQAEDEVFLPALDGVALRTGARVVGLDTTRRRIRLADGEQVHYDGLAVTTGARARTLATPGSAEELTLRGLDDVVRLRRELERTGTVTIVGGGFLGMEVASACRTLGKRVTVVDRLPPLTAQLGTFLASLVEEAARDHGVSIDVVPGGVAVTAIGVMTGEGDPVADSGLVVTAVGDVPNTEWLAGSGIEVRGGVVVDGRCRAAPDVVAAGDVTARPGTGGPRRSPHWWNALDQARTAAASLLGQDDARPRDRVPFFWTEAFGLHLRVCGELPVSGIPEVVDGSVDRRSALLRWRRTAVAMNYPISVRKLEALCRAPGNGA